MRVVKQHFIPGFLGLLLAWITVLHGAALAQAQDNRLTTDGTYGAWFLCEYAQNKNPRSDGCAALDDDGVLLLEGVIKHVKFGNSREIRWPGGRAGHCQRQGTQTCRVDLQYIGPFDAGSDKQSVRFLGCTRVYDVIAHDCFVEI